MLTPASSWVSWGAWSAAGPPLRVWALLIGWLLVCLWLVWMMGRSPRPARRSLRLFLSLWAVTVLALFGLRPFHQRPVRGESALLLTPGTTSQSLRDFRRGRPDRERVFALPGSGLEDSGLSTIPIPDIGYLKRHFPAVRRLHLFGHGLEPHQLEALRPIRIVPHLDPEALGIAFIDWNAHLELGKDLEVQGRLSQPPPEGARLVLTDPGGGETTLSGKSIPDGRFSFRDTPRTSGRHRYQLELFGDGDQSLLQEHIAVDVLPPRTFSLLILEGAPHFDTKYLKHWLADGGNRYLIRTRISKDRYRWEYGNREERPFEGVDEATLEGFDLVIADGRAIADMGDGERQSLRRVVANKGLGLLVRPDGTAWERGSDSAFFWSFEIRALEGSSTRETGLLLSGISTSPTPPIPVIGYELAPTPGQTPLVEDNLGRTLAAWSPRGQGRIGTSLVDGAYRWILQGHAEYHHSYWKRMVEVLARPPKPSDQWHILSPNPFRTDYPIVLVLRTNDPRPSITARVPGEPPVPLPPRQSQDRPRQWTTRYWPTQPGWQQVQRRGGEPFWFFVEEPGAWQSLQFSQRSRATLEYAMRPEDKDSAPATLTMPEEVPQPWLFVLFLLAVAALWLERKWSG